MFRLCVLALILIGMGPLTQAASDTLLRGNGGEPVTLDPHLMQGPSEGGIGYDFFEGLITYNAQGQLIPGQASGWQQSDDGLLWTFQVRKGLQWSDGTPLTAADFEYSFRRLANPATGAPYAWFLGSLEVINARDIIQGTKPSELLGVKATSPEQLEIRLNKPVSYLPELLAFYAFVPVPAHTINKFGSEWTSVKHFVGNGAFRLEQWLVNEKVIAVRNPLFRDDMNTRLSRVTYLTSGDELQRFRSGELHISHSLKTEHENWARKHRPDVLKSEPWMSVGMVFINTQRIIRKENRIALAQALDREAFALSKASGDGVAAYRVSPPFFQSVQPELPEIFQKPHQQQISSARKKLAELSELTVIYCNNCSKVKVMALAVAQQWEAKLGLKVRLQGYERKHYFSVLNDRQYDATVMQWIGPYKDPAALLNILEGGSPYNRSYYHSAAFDQLLAQARESREGIEQRMKIYSQAEAQLLEDMPVIPLVHHANVRLVAPELKGYTGLNPMGRLYSRHLWIE